MNVSRIALAGGVAASTVLILAGTASAHVSVQPQGEAAKGGYATVNFKVPNERDDAATTKVEVNFPTDHPLASVQPQAVPGWDIEVTRSKLAKPMEMHGQKINEAVSKVTWTATGDKDERGIRPGRFQQFPLSIGQLPEDADQLVFKAIQTYDNKEVVRWIEEQKKGAEEPESPAPVLALTAPATGEHGAAADAKSADAGAQAADKETTAASDASDSDTTARVLGIVGIVIGVAGVAFGLLAGRRRTA
ncbi:YcnI family protein [Streptomyces sp. NBC_00378]|uniref:YcnI family copper-binding membrane protein n=1 Tax=unclassified Streptomyces TaxID=2593676 RepID=UPI00224F7151|nr:MULTISPECIES: YcnI family protein [unclassified Streptomyces]MCX5110694.1 YcnI family protein [Streptomyces sp. NBC_00378]